MSFAENFVSKSEELLRCLDLKSIDESVEILRKCREAGGRLFVVGSGGGAGHASHAVCDFRKLCGIEAYCPTDNVSELTARINDDGWESSLSEYLRGSKITSRDTLLVFSVGGGSEAKNISRNLVAAVRCAREAGATVVSVVGRDGGYAGANSNTCVLIPSVDASLITPLTESFQAWVWHLIVSHPRLQLNAAKWEATEKTSDASAAKGTRLFTTKIFADGADIAGILEMRKNPLISGFTTNPTLMRKAGVKDYRQFAGEVLAVVPDLPVSFEVLCDDFPTMEAQAREIASWGPNVYVKIPVTNTKGESSAALVSRLNQSGVQVNVTALMTVEQARAMLGCLSHPTPAYLSFFAGRVADSGVDPMPMVKTILGMLKSAPHVDLIWASPRELFNLVQANESGCHIITVTNDILRKMNLIGKPLEEFSADTVKMFYDDAVAAGFELCSNTTVDSRSTVVEREGGAQE